VKRRLPLALLLAAAGLWFPGLLFAHGVEVYDLSSSPDKLVATVHFIYSTGEPMAFTKIQVYPPSNPEQGILESVTDRNGLFSFTPDEIGEWRVEAADGMGHQGSITLQGSAPTTQAPEKKADGKVPLPLRMILGLSLILNIFALYSFILKGITKKRTKQEVSHAY
jgi:nickel transport protein